LQISRVDLRRVPLNAGNPTVEQPDDTIGDARYCCVVRNDDRRRPELAINAFDGLQDHDARGDIEGAGRLVTQQNIRTLRDGAGDGDALLLTSRELRRKVIEAMLHADHRESVLWRHRPLHDLGDERNVLARGQDRNQVVEL
jgi:hypothetical protein